MEDIMDMGILEGFEDCAMIISCLPCIICACYILCCCACVFLLLAPLMGRKKNKRPNNRPPKRPYTSRDQNETSLAFKDVLNRSAHARNIGFTKHGVALTKMDDLDNRTQTIINAILNDSITSANLKGHDSTPYTNWNYSTIRNNIQQILPNTSMTNSYKVDEAIVDTREVNETSTGGSIVDFVNENVEIVTTTLRNDGLLPEYGFHGGVSTWTAVMDDSSTPVYSPGLISTGANVTAAVTRVTGGNISVVY